MGGCQNRGPFLGTLDNRCRIKILRQKGPATAQVFGVWVGVQIVVSGWTAVGTSFSGFRSRPSLDLRVGFGTKV